MVLFLNETANGSIIKLNVEINLLCLKKINISIVDRKSTVWQCISFFLYLIFINKDLQRNE